MKKTFLVFGTLLTTSLIAMGQLNHSSAAGAAPKAYVGLFKDNAVGVIDTGSNKMISSIPIPKGPHGMEISPDGKFVYVSNEGSSVVSVIDTASDKISQNIEVGSAPHGLALTRDGTRLLVAVNGADKVAVVDTKTNAVIGSIAVHKPHTIAINPDGNTAVVASQDPGHFGLITLDLTQNSITTTTPLEKAPRDVTFSQDGQRVYFTQAGANAVGIFDVALSKVSGQIATGESPHLLIFTPNNEDGLVVVQGTNALNLVDPLTNKITSSIGVGKTPHWVAVSGDSQTAFVTNEAANTVSVVNLKTKKVTATIPVGNGPRKIVVQQQ